jgi:hypothetical protein
MLPKQRRFAQEWGILSERNLLIPNNSVWNREFAKPFWAINTLRGFESPLSAMAKIISLPTMKAVYDSFIFRDTHSLSPVGAMGDG